MNNQFKSVSLNPQSLENDLSQTLTALQDNMVLKRLWAHDHTLWSDRGDEIENRLGWLHLHETMTQLIPEIEKVVEQLRNEKFERAILLGMGGSSLAPEMFYKVFGKQPGYLEITILDSTDPGAIQNIERNLGLESTIFIVSTKSGGTVETLSFFKYFYNLVSAKVETAVAGNHFIAITDPGSSLEQLGNDLNFRHIFLNHPDIGGRYSALSYFGLFPAALTGIDIKRLVTEAGKAALENSSVAKPASSFAANLGAFLGVGVKNQFDKLTFISETPLSSFSDWLEQLIAESTGKSGTGIIPVIGEPIPADFKKYSPDRIFVLHHFDGSQKFEILSSQLQSAGFPVIQIKLNNSYQIGGLILTWEIATVIAGHIIEIHPFNQPNVESAKIIARESLQAYQETGKLPAHNIKSFTANELLMFLSETQPGDYISIQAFVEPTNRAEDTFRELQGILRDKFGVAVTFGFGPRFLHSTGQLHKGDAGRGRFLQFVSDSELDIDIPTLAGSSDSFISFNVLKKAQAIGDAKALMHSGRKVISFSLKEPVENQIQGISEGVQ